MEYTSTTESEALVESARRLVRERYDYAAQRAAMGEGEAFDRRQWHEFAELGWLATSISEAGGGLGLPYATLAALGCALGPAAMREPWSSQLARAGHVLDRCAAGARRDELLGRWLAGEVLLALASGGRGDEMHCDAEAKGYRLRGTQCAVVDGSVADHYVVGARHSASGEWALLAVAADTPGVARTDHVACDGRVLADLAFDDVVLERGARLDCDARQVLEEAETLYALLLAAESLGIMQALVPMCTVYLAERRQFGRPLIEFQVLQHRLADMHIACVRAESAHLLARFKCDELGLVAARGYVAIAKAMVGQCGREVGQQAVQLHGGIGMTEDLVVGHYLKRLTANELLGGHSQIHLENAARLRGVICPHP